MSLRSLVLWRHGETDYNVALRMQGQLDSHLTPTGIGQAHRAAPILAGLRPDVLLTSDLVRASETAAVLGEHAGLAVGVDKRLRETHLGAWQGLSHAEVEDGWPGGMSTWRISPDMAPPEGETRVEVATRGAQLVTELDETGQDSAVLCTHGGLIAGLTPLLLGLPVSHWSVFGGISNCHWTVLRRRDDSWRLDAYNTAATV
ncbi:MAG: histidine phosphatase family protein [Pseudonocardiaceae bacterium]|nr:histidine phosphatase family protein [Pseudonocardiaceae bacterium]